MSQDKPQVSFSPGDRPATHSLLVLGSCLRSTDRSKAERWQVFSVNVLSQLGFHFQRMRKKNSLSWIFPVLLERSSSWSSVLNLNQAVTQEAPTACQFYEFWKPFLLATLSRHLSAQNRTGPSHEQTELNLVYTPPERCTYCLPTRFWGWWTGFPGCERHSALCCWPITMTNAGVHQETIFFHSQWSQAMRSRSYIQYR